MKPPFRADQVGSLLRPVELAKIRRSGQPKDKIREAEDRAIREIVNKQEAIGLEAITDGEFRRDWWHLDFLSQLEGVTLKAMAGPGFANSAEQPPIPTITGKVRYKKRVMVDDFVFLKSICSKTAK